MYVPISVCMSILADNGWRQLDGSRMIHRGVKVTVPMIRGLLERYTLPLALRIIDDLSTQADSDILADQLRVEHDGLSS